MSNGEEVVHREGLVEEEVVHRVPLGMGSVSIECLPDELLGQILSFLPTKEAASTSVVAKRWRTLFALGHSFDFDDSIFLHPEVGKQDRDDIQESFRSFVDRTLALHGGVPINKFLLKCGDKHDEVHVDRWINNALERGVSDLRLRITDVMRGHLPTNLFFSKTIVKLALGTKLSIDRVPSDAFLPVLKMLCLYSVWFESREFSNVFLAGCPALEDLIISHESFSGMPYIISGKTIKRLYIIYKCAEDVDYFSFLSLNAPNLVKLYYSDYALPRYRVVNLDSLVKATLDLHFLEPDEDGDEPVYPNVTDLIYGIRNVKILELTNSAVEVISQCCKGGLPLFINLFGLVFLCNKEQAWKVFLPLLLEHSPNLKTLVLSGLYNCTYDHQFNGIRIPPGNQIKTLRILYYHGSETELKHISHFLLKMECLEVVKVCFTSEIDDDNKVQCTEDLFKLPTASSKIKMQVM